MNADKFNDIVKHRANERVQQKLKVFYSDIMQAMQKLGLISAGQTFNYSTLDDAKVKWNKEIRALLQVFLIKRTMPSKLWKDEEKRVSDELLSTLDEMQKALLAAQKPMDTSEGEPQAEMESEAGDE